jgi:hypothetical protein
MVDGGAAGVRHQKLEKGKSMKKATLVWLGSTVATLALLATASWADVPERGEPQEPVSPVDQTISMMGVSNELATSLDGARSGAARFTINGESYEVTIYSQPLELAELPDNFGNWNGTTSHLLDFGNGNTITTVDVVSLSPTIPGWFNVAGTMTIVQGTGIFANIGGVLDFHAVTQLDGDKSITQSMIEGTVTL